MTQESTFQRHFIPTGSTSKPNEEPTTIRNIIDALGMIQHPEGGYFVETDRDKRLVANPWPSGSDPHDGQRTASTSIFYLLTPNRSFGAFHRNKARTVHTLHKGRGRYVIIHADGEGNKTIPRVESFVVGQDLAKGEKLQWIVEGGKYKASFLLPDSQGASSDEGLLISEVSQLSSSTISSLTSSDRRLLSPASNSRITIF